jgi:hypothetical protein
MSESKDLELQLLNEITDYLAELVRLTRAMSYSSIKQMLETALDTEAKRLVYHLLDGTRTTMSIQKLSGVNVRYVSEWGQEWEKLGIAEPTTRSGKRGGRQKSFDLSMFGIPVPNSVPDEESENNN